MAVEKYAIVVSGRAEAMLMRHTEFLAKVSVPAAKKLSVEFRKALKSLKDVPDRFPFLDMDGIPRGLYRKCLFYRRYELIFLIMETVVYIEAVRDCRQDPGHILS